MLQSKSSDTFVSYLKYWIRVKVANTLAYYDMELLYCHKKIMIQAQVKAFDSALVGV
jgi:hypothetical protein